MHHFIDIDRLTPRNHVSRFSGLECHSKEVEDTFLLKDKHFEFYYQRRKAKFLLLQEHQDISKERLFILSEDKPWEVFRNGYTSTRLQRRKMVFERTRNFPLLHQVCISSDRDQVRALLHTPGVCVLERDVSGRIALHHAVINENFKIARKLLRRRDAKLQIHVRDNSSRSPLHYVLEKMELLVLHRREGSKIPALVTRDMRVQSKRYRKLWELADSMLEMINRRVLDGMRVIDGEGGESIKQLDMRCRGDLWDVCRSGDLGRLEMIVKVYGCSKDEWELSELKRTLLHEACENQQLQIVNFLLSMMGSSVLAQDTSGASALHCAARRGYFDVCQILIDILQGNHCEESQERNGDAEEQILLQDARGRTALHWCLLGSGDSLARVKTAVFLSHSCPAALHVLDKDGVSPLHLAIWRGELELVQDLISLGASVCLVPIVPINYGEYVEKASWAPCGIVFQRPRLQKIQKVVSIAGSPAPDIISISMKNTPDWENLQHPVEALWYWARQSSGCNIRFNNRVTECNKDENCEEESVTEEELGCRKYGGICCRCKVLTTPGDSTAATHSAPKENQSQLLSPLLLALRMCALEWGNCSILDRRVAIVKLLLTNGAAPDEVSDGENKVKEVYTLAVSALSEGLRSSLRCQQIIPMLLQHGSERISISSITQWSLTSATRSKQTETVLCQLLNLETVTCSSEFVWMLFQQKHFCTLRAITKLWFQEPQNSTPNESAAEENGIKSYCIRDGSPWKLIHESLVISNKRRRVPSETTRIDIDHLQYLCALVESELWSTERASDQCVSFKWQVFECCVDMYLRQRSNGCHYDSNFDSKEGVQICEHVVLVCIRILFKYWKSNNADDQLIKSKAVTWLEPTISLGYFDCALVLLETMEQLGNDSPLLDMALEHCSSAVSTRRRFEFGQLCLHREFLIVVVENLLKVNSVPVDESKALSNSPKLDVVVSTRSVVHMCANNLPFALIKTWFDIALPETVKGSSRDKSNDLNAMRTMRVGGRTMVQWIVANARSDILQLLFMRLPAGLERGLWWSTFISASPVVVIKDKTERSDNSPNFIDNLLSVYLEHVQDHLDVNERKDVLVNLILKCAIPVDSVALFKSLVKLLGSISPDSGESHHLGIYLKQANVLHTIVRWNAVRVAEFCLSRQCSDDEPQTNQTDEWQQRFVEENQERHELDECTPLELCRQLGHLHLYNQLYSKVKSSLAEINTSGVTEVESNDFELTANIGSASEKKSTGQWQIGLIRAIIETNESLVAKNTKYTMIETFTGYRRYARIQDPWLSAVVQNQVSHLQAMSLMRAQCSSPATSVRTLILTAIKNAALISLKWILQATAPITKYLSDEEGVECMYAAAKHPGVVYAEMTLLLLEHQLSPGRLSGDGMGIPLLHRVACFSNTTLACRIMTMLLERSDCDVNALDAFGNTAVSYALAAGCLHNACFLIQNSKCRLEAEYEGQSCFYYTLHIVPSFAWRTIVRELLLMKRNRAFLHCEADNKTCGCKSYEHPREGENGDGALCGFCGHESSCHRLVPLPSWFRDQYDTYIVVASKKRSHSNSISDESDDSDGEVSQHYSTENNKDTTNDEDEEIVLENSRGRLDVQLLKRIAMLRYDDILHTNGLSIAVGDECREDVDGQTNEQNDIEKGDHDNCDPEIQVFTENEPKLVVPDRDVGDLQQRAVDFNGESISSHRKDASTRRKFTGPWWLLQELAMVHSPRCLCQKTAFVTSPAQLVHVAVCRWLRCTAKLHATAACELRSSCSPTESPIVALACVQPAFEHWCDVARRSLVDTVSKPLTPLPRILRSVLFHWRYSKEFLAFQRWRNYQTSTEVSHHRLATRLERVAAEMRRNRFITLQLRQQQLQDSTRNLLSLS